MNDIALVCKAWDCLAGKMGMTFEDVVPVAPDGLVLHRHDRIQLSCPETTEGEVHGP